MHVPYCYQNNQRRGFLLWGKGWEWLGWFLGCVSSSPAYLLALSRGMPSESALVSPVHRCGAEQWMGMAFQQGAICGTLVLSNNQICLWSRATALGHGAIFSTRNFSIYKFLLGVVALPTAPSPASWEQDLWAPAWALWGITELCNVMLGAWHLSGQPWLGSVLHPFSTLLKGMPTFPLPFHFYF